MRKALQKEVDKVENKKKLEAKKRKGRGKGKKVKKGITEYPPRRDVVESTHIINLLASGLNREETAKIVGTTKEKVNNFKNRREVGEMVKKRKSQLAKNINKMYDKEITGLAGKIVEKGHILLDTIDVDKVKKSSLSQVALAFGILIDKMRLLTDKSTKNVELKFQDREAVLGYLQDGGKKDVGVIDV